MLSSEEIIKQKMTNKRMDKRYSFAPGFGPDLPNALGPDPPARRVKSEVLHTMKPPKHPGPPIKESVPRPSSTPPILVSVPSVVEPSIKVTIQLSAKTMMK